MKGAAEYGHVLLTCERRSRKALSDREPAIDIRGLESADEGSWHERQKKVLEGLAIWIPNE